MLPPGSTIGILGGGQLGRMLAQAAAELGFDVHIYTPEEDSPASRVAARTTIAAYDDTVALTAFAKSVDVVTYEFENVPAATAQTLLAAGALVRPDARALEVSQDRLTEKKFLTDNSVAVAPHAAIDNDYDLARAIDDLGPRGILKTRRLGYDGQGQARVDSLDDARAAYRDKLNNAPSIFESYCEFEREISIIAARGVNGDIAIFDLCQNIHEHGILAKTVAPAHAPQRAADAAEGAARVVLTALDYVGVLTIEFFLMEGGALIANEMAPRVHNSGHWTMDACLTSQFEQHIRAVAGWPLGPVDRLGDAEMINLIGNDANKWEEFAADATARVHLYGKRQARPGRKMGHVTRIKPR